MKTLDEAWAWYRAVAEGAKRLTHLAKFWGDLPWGQAYEWVSRMEKDGVLRHLEADQMEKEAQHITKELDDLAVLVLFSVFEAIVRSLVEEQVRTETAQLKHPALKKAGDDALQAIVEGSFFRVLEPYKSQANDTLIEQVNQVRHYRNWVAHGRRPLRGGEYRAKVEPREAYERLKAFLQLLSPPPTATGEATAQVSQSV